MGINRRFAEQSCSMTDEVQGILPKRAIAAEDETAYCEIRDARREDREPPTAQSRSAR